MHLIPKSKRAHGACSLDDPHPKFFPVNKIGELLYGSLFNINFCIIFPFSSYLISKNKLLPSPVLFIVFKNCLGIIMSVSIFIIGRLAGIPFKILNFFILVFKFSYISQMSFNCGSCGHRRANQMCSSATSLATFKISI